MSLQFEVLRTPWPLTVPAPPIVDAVAESAEIDKGMMGAECA